MLVYCLLSRVSKAIGTRLLGNDLPDSLVLGADDLQVNLETLSFV